MIVTVEVPTAAVLVAAKVICEEYVTGLLEKLTVTPEGKPEALRFTAPENPEELLM